MTKLIRLLALAAILVLPAGTLVTPAGAADARSPGNGHCHGGHHGQGGGHHGGGHGPYHPDEPYEPGPCHPGGAVPKPAVIAKALSAEAVAGLQSVTAKQLISRKTPVELTITVARAGTYVVELERLVSRRGRGTYRLIASGSVTTPSSEPATRNLKLTATAYAVGYVKATRRTTIPLRLRAGFQPRAARHTTWAPSAPVTLSVAGPLAPVV